MKLFKHLEEAKMGYWNHWTHAISCSIALFIHAWLPCFFKDYASKKLTKN